MKRCSASLIMREMKIITTVGYHLSVAREPTVRQSKNNKCWRECGEKGTLLHWCWECQLVQSLWRTVWRFLKILKIELLSPNIKYLKEKCPKIKIKIELLYDPATPLLGLYSKKTHAPYCSIQHYLQWPKCRSNLSVYPQMNE